MECVRRNLTTQVIVCLTCPQPVFQQTASRRWNLENTMNTRRPAYKLEHHSQNDCKNECQFHDGSEYVSFVGAFIAKSIAGTL